MPSYILKNSASANCSAKSETAKCVYSPRCHKSAGKPFGPCQLPEDFNNAQVVTGKRSRLSFEHGGVTFRHHEAVGAKMTKKRLRELEFDSPLVKDVAELVRLSGRFKGYGDGWSDAAVRRYAREAGHLLGDLNELVRCDCTTRNRSKETRLHRLIDELEERIIELARADAEAAERPQIDGKAVMERYGVVGGPVIGKALAYLLEVKRTEGELDDDELYTRLDAWWVDNA